MALHTNHSLVGWMQTALYFSFERFAWRFSDFTYLSFLLFPSGSTVMWWIVLKVLISPKQCWYFSMNADRFVLMLKICLIYWSFSLVSAPWMVWEFMSANMNVTGEIVFCELLRLWICLEQECLYCCCQWE